MFNNINMNSSLNSIIIIFFSQLALSLLLLLLFMVMKRLPFFSSFYTNPNEDNKFLCNNVSEEILLEKIGLDSLIYLRMIKCTSYIFLFATILTCSILLPLHIISEPSTLTWENYDKTSDQLWAHIICTWLITIFIYSILLKQNIDITKLRILYISKHKKNPECHTVYITDIPDNIDILEECKKIYGYDSIADIVKLRLHSAFVIFKRRISHVIAITSLHHRDKLTWITKSAPNPGEIIWQNIDIKVWYRILRSISMWAIYIGIVIFYIVPITGIQWLIVFSEGSDSYLYILSINLLISLLLHIIILILPWIFGLLYKGMGVVSSHDVDFGIVNMLFYFQIVTLFIESIITGSILNNLRLLFTDPNILLQILLTGLVKSSYFFINYICVAGICGIGISNLRIFPLIKYIIKKIRGIDTDNIINELWYNQCVPTHMIIFMLGLIYCCICPIISPIVFIYSSLSLLPEKYNHIYIYNKKHNSGGILWISIFNQMMASLYIFQLIMLFEFYSVYEKFVTLLPLPFITLLYHYTSGRLFNELLETIPLHDAALLDEREQELTTEEYESIRINYTPP